eukprot:gene52692-71898_t
MIDEYPILFVAAALAQGRTVARGAHELRVKESDRIATMAAALTAIGVPVEEFEDGLAITGSGGDLLPGGGQVASQLDHRIAMSMAIAGLVCRTALTIDDVAPIATSMIIAVDGPAATGKGTNALAMAPLPDAAGPSTATNMPAST